MREFVRQAQRFLHVIGKLFILRAFAVGPISREDEARLLELMAADPPVWGFRRRPQ